MNELKINETPIRTSRNFNINNIKLNDFQIPEKTEKFENFKITGKTPEIQIEEKKNDTNITYGLGKILIDNVEKQSNKNLKITSNSKNNEVLEIKFEIDERNENLIENLNIVGNEDTKTSIVLRYMTTEDIEGFHNGIIKVLARKNSEINITIINLTNETTSNFLSIENSLEERSRVNYTIVDFGGKYNITNYYSNLKGDLSDNQIKTIYIGKNNQTFDMNYIGELRGESTNIDIDVQGALKNSSKKHFKGTIDFKKGCKKAKGNENEICMLLSETAKSIALPMLLCSEEDVEGNHSSSAGKIGEKELFYITSRGFELKEAMKLMVRAKFNKVLESITNDKLRKEIIEEIDKRLD